MIDCRWPAKMGKDGAYNLGVSHLSTNVIRNMRAALRVVLALCVACPAISKAAPPFDPNFIGRMVVFLYATTSEGNPDINTAIGTAFLIRVPHLHDDKATLLLATARHLLDPEWVHCPGQHNPEILFARVNARKGGTGEKVRYIKLVLSNQSKRMWAKHRRNDIDAAVIVFPAKDDDLLKSDISFLPMWRLPTDGELAKVSVGDDIVSAGMLVELGRTSRNYPVFKFGKVSNILEEDIHTSCERGEGVNVNAWLIAANLVPGNSGSPVFYYPPFGEHGDIGSPGLDRLVLLGIQSSSSVPSDVAFMTPATYLSEIIEDMKLPDANLYLGKKTAK